MRSDLTTNSQQNSGKYLFVWGDTVVGRNLILAIVIAVLGALAGLYGGKMLFAAFIESDKLIDVWSLVTGIAGSVGAGVVTGILFKPARIVTADAKNASSIDNVLDEMAESPQGLGRLSDATAKSRKELDTAGLTEVFEQKAREVRNND